MAKERPDFLEGISYNSVIIDGSDILEDRKLYVSNYLVLDLSEDPRVDELLKRVEKIKSDAKTKPEKERDDFVIQSVVTQVHEIFGNYNNSLAHALNNLDSNRSRMKQLELEKEINADDKNQTREIQTEIDCVQSEIDRLEQEVKKSKKNSNALSDYNKGELDCRYYAALTTLACQKAGINCRFIAGYATTEEDESGVSTPHAFVFINKNASIVEATIPEHSILKSEIDHSSILKGDTLVVTDAFLGMRAYGTGRISQDDKSVDVNDIPREEFLKKVYEYDKLRIAELADDRDKLLEKCYKKEKAKGPMSAEREQEYQHFRGYSSKLKASLNKEKEDIISNQMLEENIIPIGKLLVGAYLEENRDEIEKDFKHGFRIGNPERPTRIDGKTPLFDSGFYETEEFEEIRKLALKTMCSTIEDFVKEHDPKAYEQVKEETKQRPRSTFYAKLCEKMADMTEDKKLDDALSDKMAESFKALVADTKHSELKDFVIREARNALSYSDKSKSAAVSHENNQELDPIKQAVAVLSKNQVGMAEGDLTTQNISAKAQTQQMIT